jgi:hypothetical protein
MNPARTPLLTVAVAPVFDRPCVRRRIDLT